VIYSESYTTKNKANACAQWGYFALSLATLFHIPSVITIFLVGLQFNKLTPPRLMTSFSLFCLEKASVSQSENFVNGLKSGFCGGGSSRSVECNLVLYLWHRCSFLFLASYTYEYLKMNNSSYVH
jgi:hypothetical protein